MFFHIFEENFPLRMLWYRRNEIKKNGCSIDLVIKNEGSIPLSFGFKKSQSNCLLEIGAMNGKGDSENHDATNNNT